jgi:hypothetical protein
MKVNKHVCIVFQCIFIPYDQSMLQTTPTISTKPTINQSPSIVQYFTQSTSYNHDYRIRCTHCKHKHHHTRPYRMPYQHIFLRLALGCFLPSTRCIVPVPVPAPLAPVRGPHSVATLSILSIWLNTLLIHR